MVQSKIKIEEYARGSGACSRAGSVASGHHQRVNSLVPQPGAAARIHPVQRFSSEGPWGTEKPKLKMCKIQDFRRKILPIWPKKSNLPNCRNFINFGPKFRIAPLARKLPNMLILAQKYCANFYSEGRVVPF